MYMYIYNIYYNNYKNYVLIIIILKAINNLKWERLKVGIFPPPSNIVSKLLLYPWL